MKCDGKTASAMRVPVPTLGLVGGTKRRTSSAEVEVPDGCPFGQPYPLALGDQNEGLVGWKRGIHC